MGHRPGHAFGVSLWLSPEGVAREHLARQVAELAARQGTPAFQPHLTLLGGIDLPDPEVLHRSRDLARRLFPVSIRLTAPDGFGDYFRCLFLRAEESPDLLAAHARAREAFDRQADPPFVPHLSLLYGRLGPEEKRALLAELSLQPQLSFEARHLHVVRTKGPPPDWREMAAFLMGDDKGQSGHR